jgi:hypothetical protein
MDISKVKGEIKSLIKLPKFKLTKISTYFNTAKETQIAEAFVSNVSGRYDVPQGDWVREDLRDIEGPWTQTKNGFSVSGQVLPIESHIGSASPVIPAILAGAWTSFYLSLLFAKAGMPVLAILSLLPGIYVMTRYIDGFGQVKQGTLAILIFAISMGLSFTSNAIGYLLGNSVLSLLENMANIMPIFMPLIYWKDLVTKRAKALAQLGNHYSGAILSSPKTKKNTARWTQALAAKRDELAGAMFLKFGTAEGILSFMGDSFAPDKGLPFGASFEDMKKHSIMFGSTGKGKSSGFLRAIIAFLIKQDCGLWISDGKNSLPNEIKSDKVKLISPETVKHFNFIMGLPPVEIGQIFRNTLAPRMEGDQNSQFKDKSQSALTDMLIFKEELQKNKLMSKSLGGLVDCYTMYCSEMKKVKDEVTEEVVDDIPNHPLISLFFETQELAQKLFARGTVLNQAFNRFVAFHNSDEKERSLITFSLESWLTPFTQNDLLTDWLHADDSDVNLEDLTRGAMFSFVLPIDKFGLAGVIIHKLVQNRINKILANRGDKWQSVEGQKHVFMVTDECQDIYDKSVSDAMATMRGFGGTYICATQNYESLEVSLTQGGAAKFWDGFANYGTFQSSEKTYAMISKKVGEQKIWQTTAKTEMIAYSTTAQLQLSNSIFDIDNPNRQDMLSSGIEKELFGIDGLWAGEKDISFLKRVLGGGSSTQPQKRFFSNEGVAKLILSEKAIPLFNDVVIDQLKEPFKCFINIDIGGVPRRDVIRAMPLTSDFESLDDKIDAENKKMMEEFNITE